jgi:hypothetical protein
MPTSNRRPADADLPQDASAADEIVNRTASSLSADEMAQYIAEFSAELSFLARQTKLDLLAYLLDMARLEATRTVQRNKRKARD